MNTISDLHLLDIKPETPTKMIVIWLHGLGASANDFEPVLPIINEKVSGIRYIFPSAPLKKVGVNGGMMMPAWYDIRTPDLSQDQDLVGIDESCHKLEQIVNQLQNETNNVIPIILAGFSQGGVIALTTALVRDINIAGVLALSTYFPNISNSKIINFTCKNLLMMHGLNDPVVPIDFAKQSYDKVSKQLTNSQWKEFPMDHSLCYEEVVEIGIWLNKLLQTN